MRFTLVAGLPNSGKRKFALSLVENGHTVLMHDNVVAKDSDHPEHIIITSRSFCSTRIRKQLTRYLTETFHKCEIVWHYMGTKAADCIAAAEKEEARAIKYLDSMYEIPRHVEPIELESVSA